MSNMTKQALIEEYESRIRRIEEDHAAGLRLIRSSSFWYGAAVYGMICMVLGVALGALSVYTAFKMTIPMAFEEVARVAYMEHYAQKDSTQ